MCMLALLAVDELQHYRPLDVEPGYLVESRGWEEDLGTIVELRAIRSGSHYQRVTAIVLVEALGAS